MKCSLGISNFLEEITSLSHSVVFLYFLCQYGKKVAIANIARSQTIAVSFDILDKILKDAW